jgi:ribosomal protein L40E
MAAIICSKCGASLVSGAKFCVKCGEKQQAQEEKKEKNEETNTCLSCGTMLLATAKFCTKCGKAVETAKKEEETLGYCSCGAAWTPSAKFCVKCGNPREKQVLTEEKKIQEKKEQVLPPKQKMAVAPPKKKRKLPKIAAFLAIAILVGAAAYFSYDMFFGGIKKKLLLEQTVGGSETDELINYEDKLIVNIPYGLVDQEEKLSLYSVKGLPKQEGLSMLNAYDVNISNMTEFEGYLEISFAYDPADLPQGADPQKDLFCMYYNEKDKTWEALPYEINTATNTITVYTNHLTTFAPWAVSEKIEPSPTMKVLKVPFPGGNYMKQNEVLETMENYAAVSPNSKSASMQGWEKVSEWFGIVSQGSAFAENALEMGALSGINQVATEVGLSFALVQCAIDVANGKTGKATLELSKNLYNYWAIKLINTSAINLAFVGVFAIDWSLNKFIQEAINERVNIYQKSYDLYYKEKRKKEKINNVYWYKKLKRTMRSVNHPNQASEAVIKVIKDYVWEFWQDESVVGEYMSRVNKATGFTGGGYLNEQLKKDISDEHFASIINTLNKTGVFDRIVKEIRLDMQGKLYDRLCYIQKELNSIHRIQIIVKQDPEDEEFDDINLSDLPLQFTVSNPVHKDMWKGKTDKNGEMEFHCTNLGYLDAGCPEAVEVTIEDGEDNEIVFSGALNLQKADKTTVVEIIIGGPKLDGVWAIDAVCTEAIMDASLQYLESFSDKMGTSEEFEEGKKQTTNALIGKKVDIPDVDFDMIMPIWDKSKEGKYHVISSPGFEDKDRLGGTQYKIMLTGRNSFEGTMETRSNYGGKTNIMKYKITGRKKR